MPTINTVLGPIFADVQGDSGLPTAVLWSSFFTDHRMWGVQVECLREAGWRTIAIDPPGQGQSPGPGRAFKMDECTDVVLEVINALDVSCPVVMLKIAISIKSRLTKRTLLNRSTMTCSSRTW